MHRDARRGIDDLACSREVASLLQETARSVVAAAAPVTELDAAYFGTRMRDP